MLPRRTALSPKERGERIKQVRLSLAPRLGGNVSLARFGELVAEAIGQAKPFTGSAAQRWENGAEPGLLAGCGIAMLGGVRPEELAFAPEGALPSGGTDPDDGLEDPLYEPLDEGHERLRISERERKRRA